MCRRRKLSQEEGLGDISFKLPRTEQDSHRDGQVIGRSSFFKVGGSQVDHDAPHRESETRVSHGGAGAPSRARAPRSSGRPTQKNWVTRALYRLQPRRERLQDLPGRTNDLGQHIQATC